MLGTMPGIWCYYCMHGGASCASAPVTVSVGHAYTFRLHNNTWNKSILSCQRSQYHQLTAKAISKKNCLQDIRSPQCLVCASLNNLTRESLRAVTLFDRKMWNNRTKKSRLSSSLVAFRSFWESVSCVQPCSVAIYQPRVQWGSSGQNRVQSQLQIMILANLDFEVGELVVNPVVRNRPLGFQRLWVNLVPAAHRALIVTSIMALHGPTPARCIWKNVL